MQHIFATVLAIQALPGAASDATCADGVCLADVTASVEGSSMIQRASAGLRTLVDERALHDDKALQDWQGDDLHLTHYWDCSGQGCDAPTLQPWDQTKFVSAPGYGPQNPEDHGGAQYGERLWVTGAASDTLSQLMGDDDPCCGHDDNDGGVGGCGKCLLVQNPDAAQPDWTAVVMKKNRCPPWSHGCDQAHFDIAVPGFDNLQYSTANICGNPHTGMTKEESCAVGSWFDSCSNTAECVHLCDGVPEEFQPGCRLFASWGWTTGAPPNVRYRAVECPAAFKEHVQAQFGASGPGGGAGGSPPAPSAGGASPKGGAECCAWEPFTSCGETSEWCMQKDHCVKDCGGKWLPLGL